MTGPEYITEFPPRSGAYQKVVARRMTAAELRRTLARMQLSQTGFARELGVSARAVALWVAGDRHVPSPVIAYLELRSKLPPFLVSSDLGWMHGYIQGTPA